MDIYAFIANMTFIVLIWMVFNRIKEIETYSGLVGDSLKHVERDLRASLGDRTQRITTDIDRNYVNQEFFDKSMRGFEKHLEEFSIENTLYREKLDALIKKIEEDNIHVDFIPSQPLVMLRDPLNGINDIELPDPLDLTAERLLEHPVKAKKDKRGRKPKNRDIND